MVSEQQQAGNEGGGGEGGGGKGGEREVSHPDGGRPVPTRDPINRRGPGGRGRKTESPSGAVLTRARKILWRGNPPKYLGWLLNPLRTYLFDPSCAVNSVLLPVLLPPAVDGVVAVFLDYLCVPVVGFLYGSSSSADETDGGGGALCGEARISILDQPSAVTIEKPTDWQSSFAGGISFLCSAIGDAAGVLSNPKKFRGWTDALGQFNAFLASTGVQDEMIEAIQKPLLRGRLMDNFKILNDVQEIHHADRVEAASLHDDGGENEGDRLREDIRIGHRLMRFATAAYGTEMIRSALDENIDASDFVGDDDDDDGDGGGGGGAEDDDEDDDPARLTIAHHTGVETRDIKFIYAGCVDDGCAGGAGDKEGGGGGGKGFDEHTLHHYVSVCHDLKAVVLAIRGTLSLSGVIVDIQGMAVDYCSGLAHKGISEMASNLWKESGEKIIRLMRAYGDYKLIVTGHSLGAGTACLLTMLLYADRVFPHDRVVQCHAFAPPPTFCFRDDDDKDNKNKNGNNNKEGKGGEEDIRRAVRNTVAYIHDNDVVPFLSVNAVRRMIRLLDAVDNETENIWFWKRWRIFYEYDPVPESIVEAVLNAEKMNGGDASPSPSPSSTAATEGKEEPRTRRIRQPTLIIPARRVCWMKHNLTRSRFDAFSCDPDKIARGNIFLCPDMVSDHMPEQYENALDSALLTSSSSSTTATPPQ